MLDAFSIRDMQMFSAMHKVLSDAGVTEAASYVAAETRRRASAMAGAAWPVKREILRCPECGYRLSPVINADGLAIVGCKSCRYSRIVEG